MNEHQSTSAKQTKCIVHCIILYYYLFTQNEWVRKSGNRGQLVWLWCEIVKMSLDRRSPWSEYKCICKVTTTI